MKRFVPYAAAAASGALAALSLPLAVPLVSLREIDPAGWLEPLAFVALVPALLSVRAAPSLRSALCRGLVAALAYFYAAIWWVSHAMTAFGGLPTALSLVALTLLVLYMAAHWTAAFGVSWTIRRRLGWPLHLHLPAVLVALTLLVLYMAVHWMAAFGVSWTIRRHLGWPLHLHLPVVFVALELSRNYLFTGFPWANLGYTQARTLPIAQLAALAGPYGIAFLVVLVNSVVAESIAARREGRVVPLRALAATGAILAATAIHGEVRLSRMRARMASAPRLTVGIVQPNVDQSTKNTARDHLDYILSRLVPLTEEADRRGADLVAWPEGSYPPYVRPGTRSFAGEGSGLRPLRRAHLLMGAATVEWVRGSRGDRVPRVGNVDLLLSPSLDVLGSYQKHHLVPFGEYVPLERWLPFLHQIVPSFAPSTPGSELKVLEFPLAAGPAATATMTSTATTTALPDPVRLAPMICFDAIFPEINVALARKDPEPEILVNPTNDAWYGYSSGPYQFLAIVRLRAIEAGKAVVRPAYAGVSAVILPTGELAPGAIEVGPVDPDLAPDPAEPARLLMAAVPRLRGSTLYTRFGDLFAYGCAIFTAAALAAAVAAGRRRRGT